MNDIHDKRATPEQWRQRADEARDEARAWELKGHLERARSTRAYAVLCEGHAVIGEIAEHCREDLTGALTRARELGLIEDYAIYAETNTVRIRLRAAASYVTIALDAPAVAS